MLVPFPVPFPRVPVTSGWCARKITRAQVRRAYLESLGRRVRDATCACLRGAQRCFCSFLHRLGVAALRARQDLWVASVMPRYTTFTVSQLGSAHTSPRDEAAHARSLDDRRILSRWKRLTGRV